MSSKINFINYEITDDDNLFDKEHYLTPSLKDKLAPILAKAIKGDVSIIDELHDLIEKNPKNPQLKNHLSTVYANSNNIQKAFEMTHWIVKEHPNYLFGKINLATKFYIKEDYEKMAEILGKSMLLQDLYPNRTIFHINEVLSFLLTTIKYFSGINDFDQAKIRLEILKDLDEGLEKYDQANRILFSHINNAALDRFKKEEELRIKVENNYKNIYKSTMKNTKFNHKEIDYLYKKGYDINEKFFLDDLLALPRKTLIEDLENVLIDSVKKASFYINEYENNYTEGGSFFVLHTLFLLKELKSTASLPVVLEVLKQDDEYIEVFLSDMLTEHVWEVIFTLGNNNLDLLTDFMLTKGLNTFAKSAINDAVVQMYYHAVLPKKEVEKWAENILTVYLNASIDDNIIDSTLIGFIVSDLTEMRSVTLLPLIKQLFDKNYVDVTIHGDYPVIQKEINSSGLDNLRKVNSIFELYSDLLKFFSSRDDYDKSDETKEFNDFIYSTIVKPKKVGRNDPCTCGSGKKYKKCCLNS